MSSGSAAWRRDEHPCDAMSDPLDSTRQTGELELFRTRVQRFCSHDAEFALAEELVDRHARRRPLCRVTWEAIARFRASWRRGDALELAVEHVAAVEGIDLPEAIARRLSVPAAPATRLDTATFIVGAPRSGTTWLYNLLAYEGAFSYPTTVSCHRWPTWGLRHGTRSLLHECPAAILQCDTKTLRLRNEYALPSEYESLFHRAMPVYDHLGGHDYAIRDADSCDAEMLRADAGEHAAWFGNSNYLSKSPFHSFRMGALAAAFGDGCRFLHIVRGEDGVALSLSRNRFSYRSADGRPLLHGEARALFVGAIDGHPDRSRVRTICFEELRAQPRRGVAAILEWLGVPARNADGRSR
jgi:hypothetical protein